MRLDGVTISVVIPTLNEQTQIERALACTRAPGVERIVVDANSSDGTSQTARFLRAEKVIQALPGRARQMDAGYREASGAVVLFLHADTRLEPGWSEAVLAALEDPGVAGGAFGLRFEAPGLGYRLIERGVELRSRIVGLPYGDQALFVRKRVLDLAGGIRPVPIFEDLDLVQAIKRAGRLALLRACVFTSARRYARNGVLRQLVRNNTALAGYLLDLERERIARWYRRRPAS
ncbi:MAG: TIGR04283 family arsenosugar biosynthesis glycosyltransferase [Myxococcota bacterium]